MNRFCRVVLMTLMLASFFPAAATAQTANDVVRAFLKLQAKTETGVSIRDYSAALADVKAELAYLDDGSASAAQASALKELKTALELHTEASQLWQLSIGRYGTKFLEEKSSTAMRYLERYPDSGKPIADGGALMSGMGVYIEALIPYLWRDAAKHVEDARAMLLSKAKDSESSQDLPRKGKKKAS